MPYVSHRSAEARRFDCLYDPNYIVPTDRDVLHASFSAADNATVPQVYAKYDVMFENSPKETRLLFRKQQSLPIAPTRLEGGANLGANLPTNRKLQKVIASAGECKSQPPSSGLYLFQPRLTNNVNVINVRLTDSPSQLMYDRSATGSAAVRVRAHQQCKNFDDFDQPKRKRIMSKTRGTQTLYRESSAQTLPYLPETSNDKDFLDTLELFRLPTILPGDGPPGLYEVEVLERARKRWAFTEALKENFQKQLNEAREQTKLPEHRNILEAFEWENWIEREEYIQECQMLRLNLLIRMFDQREKEMHDKSKSRLIQRCEEVAAKREAALRKNDVEYKRALRRLEAKRQNVARNWRKDNICNELGQPDSEFYAPQMRYGVNPNRRHFAGGRKAFETRMDDLEKKAVNMRKLVCPYAKLKELSKPKEPMTEVEQNFCSDENLKKLYENLKNLREQSAKQKTAPKCLIEKTSAEPLKQTLVTPRNSIEDEKPFARQVDGEEINDGLPMRETFQSELQSTEYESLRLMSDANRKRIQFLLAEKRHEELDAMVAHYEGSSIGWLMRFLTEEMERLQEQRKLHFISMLAQRERWRREAAEAGLRQKENDMRQIYEQLYQETNVTNTEASQKYLEHILCTEVDDYAKDEATMNVLALARLIDEDIQRWLTSFEAIQTPMNWYTLREILKGVVFPNVEKLLVNYEAQKATQYIIDRVLFPHVNKLLEPYDIGVAITNETIDRTIDTDLHYMSSSECSSACEICPANVECSCTPEKLEANALMRKLIRHVVPGRRWKTQTERVALENVNDILNDAFGQLVCKGYFKDKAGGIVHATSAHANLMEPSSPGENGEYLDSGSSQSQLQHIHNMELGKYISFESKKNVTRDLNRDEIRIFGDLSEPSDDSEVLQYETLKEDRTHQYPYRQVSAMRQVMSAYDIMSIRDNFSPISTSSMSSSSGEAVSVHEQDSRENVDAAMKRYLDHLINQVVKTMISAEEGDSDISEYITEEEEEALRSFQVEESENTPRYALESVLRDVLGTISSDSIVDEQSRASEQSDFPEEELQPYEEENDYYLEISESELELLKIERCKCEAELIREAYVKEMLIRGRVRIKRKLETAEEHQEKMEELRSDTTLDAESIGTFEYDSDTRKSELMLKPRKSKAEPEVDHENVSISRVHYQDEHNEVGSVTESPNAANIEDANIESEKEATNSLLPPVQDFQSENTVSEAEVEIDAASIVEMQAAIDEPSVHESQSKGEATNDLQVLRNVEEPSAPLEMHAAIDAPSVVESKPHESQSKGEASIDLQVLRNVEEPSAPLETHAAIDEPSVHESQSKGEATNNLQILTNLEEPLAPMMEAGEAVEMEVK